jgi:cell division protein FtsI (penicillin-binding protein 3)
MKNRELFIGIVFSTLFCVIAARATYLHVIKHEWLAEKAESQYSRTKIATGKRGTIFDANNNVLALSSELTSVGADPSQYPSENKAAEIRDTSNKLGKILGINAWNLRKKLLAGKSFTWIKKKVPPAEANEIKSLKSDPKKNKWIVLQEDHNRYYPNCELAGQVLGFTGTDEKGLEGIEFQFNNDLQAPVDKYMVTKDAHGQCFRTDTDNPVGFTGNSLTLTIDRQIQYAAECALKDAALEYKIGRAHV